MPLPTKRNFNEYKDQEPRSEPRSETHSDKFSTQARDLSNWNSINSIQLPPIQSSQSLQPQISLPPISQIFQNPLHIPFIPNSQVQLLNSDPSRLPFQIQEARALTETEKLEQFQAQAQARAQARAQAQAQARARARSRQDKAPPPFRAADRAQGNDRAQDSAKYKGRMNIAEASNLAQLNANLLIETEKNPSIEKLSNEREEIYKKIGIITPLGLSVLQELKDPEQITNLLFLINLFGEKTKTKTKRGEISHFEKIFSDNNTRGDSKLDDQKNSVMYVLENLNKFMPLIENFSRENLSSMLFLTDKLTTSKTLSEFYLLIRTPQFEKLKELLPTNFSSFISKTANYRKFPEHYLAKILDNIDGLKEIKEEMGFNDNQMSTIFYTSHYKIGDNIKSFIENKKFIKKIVEIKEDQDSNKNRLSYFLGAVANYGFKNLIPLFKDAFEDSPKEFLILLKNIAPTVKTTKNVVMAELSKLENYEELKTKVNGILEIKLKADNADHKEQENTMRRILAMPSYRHMSEPTRILAQDKGSLQGQVPAPVPSLYPVQAGILAQDQASLIAPSPDPSLRSGALSHIIERHSEESQRD